MTFTRLQGLFLLLFLCTSHIAYGQPEFTNARLSTYGGFDSLIDANGNIIRVSNFLDSLDVDRDGIDDIASLGGTDIILLSEAPNGSLNWIRTFGSTVEGVVGPFGLEATDEARDVTQDASGNLYVGGFFYEAIDFDNDQILDIAASAPDTAGLFITQYTPEGVFQWATAFGGHNDVMGKLQYNPTSNTLYAAGTHIVYDESGALAPSDVLLAELSTTGEILQERIISISELFPPIPELNTQPHPIDVQFDSAHNIYVLGRYFSSRGGPPLALFLAKFNSSLELQWVRQSSGTSPQIKGILIDSQDHIWLSGSYRGSPLKTIAFTLADADTSYVAPQGDDDFINPSGLFLARYSQGGSIDCLRFIPNPDGKETRPLASQYYLLQPFPPSIITGIVASSAFDLDGDGETDLADPPNAVTLFMSVSTDCSFESAWTSEDSVYGIRVLKGPDDAYRMEGIFSGSQLLLDGLEDEPPVLNDELLASFGAELTFIGPTLPVELVDFSLLKNQDSVILTWETASETNNAGFEVQQTRENGSWDGIAFVEGAGTTNQAHSYTHTASNLDPGAYQFRLKQIDFDGTFTYSDTQSIHIGPSHAFALSQAYPNPFNPTTTFTLSVARAQDVRIDLYDLTGRHINKMHDGPLSANTTHSFTIEGNQLSSGVYVYRVEGTYFTTSRKVLLLK